jgi:2-polyprenyl-3-methyl-5-hydroxy-6-metoxy-1,4-benzoquinol methylase
VVEVGCGSGVLLVELRTRGYECIGVEPDEQTAEWGRESRGLDVRPGFFPDVDLPKCDLFLAFDVIEHALDPEAFMKEVAQLLNPGSVAIIQTPIDRYGYQPPFKNMFDAVFDDLEHLYIFTTQSIHRLEDTTGFITVAEDSWQLAHEVVVLRKRSQCHD